MVCLGNICINTLRKGDDDDDEDEDDDDNNNVIIMRSLYGDSQWGWKVRGTNLWCEIFRTRLDRQWGPSSLLYNGYWVSFPGVKRPGRGVDHPPHRLKKE
jgi:hypothetical protein